uniref:Uncharacterized protein n=1 Tax=Timema shepardi TaxID=629360 RepID=A0A7R9B6C8_TIMSH|nr:unnamed protein product [Timema shepardi]
MNDPRPSVLEGLTARGQREIDTPKPSTQVVNFLVMFRLVLHLVCRIWIRILHLIYQITSATFISTSSVPVTATPMIMSLGVSALLRMLEMICVLSPSPDVQVITDGEGNKKKTNPPVSLLLARRCRQQPTSSTLSMSSAMPTTVTTTITSPDMRPSPPDNESTS